MSSAVPIPFAGEDTLSLRQLDELNALPKGSTFRQFKACEAELVEGRDYHYLAADEHAPFIEVLKQAGQVYATSRHLVLLTRRGYEYIRVHSQGG